MTAGPVLEVVNLVRHYEIGQGFLRRPATLKALDGISFSLAPGKTLAVVGESGSGKSTLARQITLIETPTSGEIRVAGRDIESFEKSERPDLRRTIQMIFQDPYGSLNPRKSVGAILAEPLAINTSLNAGQRRERVHAMMSKVGLRPELSGRFPHMFSGGQRQRIAIGRALMLNPRIVVADEPVSALDVSVQAQVINLMLDLKDEFQLAYVFISMTFRSSVSSRMRSSCCIWVVPSNGPPSKPYSNDRRTPIPVLSSPAHRASTRRRARIA